MVVCCFKNIILINCNTLQFFHIIKGLIDHFYHLVKNKGPQSQYLITYLKNFISSMEQNHIKVQSTKFVLQFQYLVFGVGKAIADIRSPQQHYMQHWGMHDVEAILAKGAPNDHHSSNQEEDQHKSKKSKGSEHRSDKKDFTERSKPNDSQSGKQNRIKVLFRFVKVVVGIIMVNLATLPSILITIILLLLGRSANRSNICNPRIRIKGIMKYS